jgi:predicted PurR-regulated permease PerM
MMRAVQARLWGRRGLAVAVMTTAFMLVLVVPLWSAITVIVDHADDVAAIAKEYSVAKFPPPPEWLARVPVAGPKVAAFWTELSASSRDELAEKLLPYARVAAAWAASQAGGLGKMVLHFVLTVAIAAILYSSGETAAATVLRFARRLAGERGERVAALAGQAVRAVALGVVVTAIVQTTLAGIWSIVVGTLDNFLRPWLIKRGADLPILLILVGVIGGLLAFGVIGLFVGPVVLAVTYTLLEAWMKETDTEAPAGPGAATGPSS